MPQHLKPDAQRDKIFFFFFLSNPKKSVIISDVYKKSFSPRHHACEYGRRTEQLVDVPVTAMQEHTYSKTAG